MAAMNSSAEKTSKFFFDKHIGYSAFTLEHGQDFGAEDLFQLLQVPFGQAMKGPVRSKEPIGDNGMKMGMKPGIISEKANLSIKWILTGTGPVFTGGSEPDAETPTPDPSASTAPGSPAPALLSSQLGEAIQIAVNILQSGTSYSQALW
jgi:hypothetical protein